MRIITLLLCSFSIATASADCTNAYASATYGLAHAKKSLSANNFDHQQYYAERALTAFEKTEGLAQNCGCEGSRNPILNGMDNLRKAIDPKDWEMGRYYTKKALANAQELMAALDVCTSGGDPVSYSDSFEEVSEGSEDLKNPEELEAQLMLKRLAELTLLEMEKSVRELGRVLDCPAVADLKTQWSQKTEEALEGEGLEDTRAYYRKQTMMVQQQAMQALSACTGTPADEAALSGKN